MRFINRAFALTAAAALTMAAAGSANAAWNYQGKPGKPHRMTLEAESQTRAYTEHVIRRSTVKPFVGGGSTGSADRSAKQQMSAQAPAYTERSIRNATTKPFFPFSSGFSHRKGAATTER